MFKSPWQKALYCTISAISLTVFQLNRCARGVGGREGGSVPACISQSQQVGALLHTSQETAGVAVSPQPHFPSSWQLSAMAKGGGGWRMELPHKNWGLCGEWTRCPWQGVPSPCLASWAGVGGHLAAGGSLSLTQASLQWKPATSGRAVWRGISLLWEPGPGRREPPCYVHPACPRQRSELASYGRRVLQWGCSLPHHVSLLIEAASSCSRAAQPHILLHWRQGGGKEALNCMDLGWLPYLQVSKSGPL